MAVNMKAIEAEYVKDREMWGDAIAARLAAARRTGRLDKVLAVRREIAEAAEAAAAAVSKPKKAKPRKPEADRVWDLSDDEFEQVAAQVEARRDVEFEAAIEADSEYTEEALADVYGDETS